MGVLSVKGLSLSGLALLMASAGPGALAAELDAAASGAGATRDAIGMKSEPAAAVTTPIPQLAPLECEPAGDDPVFSRLCKRPSLQALDTQLRELYAGLSGHSVPAGVDLAGELASWQAKRTACAEAPDISVCIEMTYLEQISRLQAQFALVPSEGPIAYACAQPALPLSVTFFATPLPTVAVRLDGDTRLAHLHPDGGGIHYVGSGLTFTEQRAAAHIQWDQRQLSCDQQPDGR